MIAGKLNHYNFDMMDKVLDINKECTTLTTMEGGSSQPKILLMMKEKQNENSERGVVQRVEDGEVVRYNIRRLTPRECYRLMDMDEKNIDLLLSNPNIIRSKHYRLAGNSIVVSCMYHIFKNLFNVDNTNN